MTRLNRILVFTFLTAAVLTPLTGQTPDPSAISRLFIEPSAPVKAETEPPPVVELFAPAEPLSASLPVLTPDLPAVPADRETPSTGLTASAAASRKRSFTVPPVPVAPAPVTRTPPEPQPITWLKFAAAVHTTDGSELYYFRDTAGGSLLKFTAGGTAGDLRLAKIDGDVFIFQRGAALYRVARYGVE